MSPGGGIAQMLIPVPIKKEKGLLSIVKHTFYISLAVKSWLCYSISNLDNLKYINK